MSFGRYRLISQLGAGRDGVRYRASDREDGSPVEMILLAEARADPDRWRAIHRRVRVALMIAHPSSRRVVGLEMEGSSPFLAMEWLEGPTLAEAGREKAEASARTAELALALAAGHRLGLALGRVGPGSIRRRGQPSGELVLDWLGLDLDTPSKAGPTGNLDASYRAPELAGGGEPDASSDIYSLGAILDWRLGGLRESGEGVDPVVARLLREMLAPDPAARPSARIVADRLTLEGAGIVRQTHVHLSNPAAETSVTTEFAPDGRPVEDGEPLGRDRLGRFRLLGVLGQGGMGTVYRGEDLADGSLVAVKVLNRAFAGRPESLRRFHKEARLLAEVNNPRVANLIELNEDEGVHYLVLEYVDGTNLADWMLDRGPADERASLAILADVARALEPAHARGIVHRDIKPENILVVRDPARVNGSTDRPRLPRAKLSDFGLARHVVESESLVLTRDGAIIGTPLYMAPEQCAGESKIGPGADVYAMGATLFTLLAGRPPFAGDSPLVVMAKHRTEPTPDLKALVPTVSDAAASIVNKAMAKIPEHRYLDAGEVLVDLERLLRGEPTGLERHPRLPEGDARDVVTYDWRWDLESSPRALWPLVSNTERFNRAIGLSSVRFDAEADPDGGSKQTGRFRKAGVDFAWREHPFEWIEGRRMGVVREFDRGPFEWFISVVELAAKSGGGTTLTHQVRIKPRGIVGRTVAAVEIGTRGRRSIDRVYRRIDATLSGKLGRDPILDPYEPPEPLSGERRRRLERWLDTLGSRGFNPQVVERMGDFLELAPAQEVARIRPLALARRLALEPQAVVDACFRGASDGVLMLLWDILCPVCRIPSQVMDTLRALRDHGHCESCQLDFELDFANSVEVIFRVHPEIRETDVATYCAGSPSHSPHVAAQARVAPGERVVLDLTLEAGSYRLRGPQLPYAIDFRVEPGVSVRRWDLDLGRGPDAELPRSLGSGGQMLAMANGLDREVLVRVERVAPREDALTAARASSLALFRELFPGEVLSPGQLISLDTVTLLVTDLDHAGDLYADLGDARAFAIVLEQFRLIDARVRSEGGALIKTVHEGTVSAFTDPSSAVRAALGLAGDLAGGEQTQGLALRVGVHRGPAMVATLNDHLDYFGTTVSIASRLPGLARGGQVVLTRPVASDPKVAALLEDRKLVPTVAEVELDGLDDRFVHRIEPLSNGRAGVQTTDG
jgi:serine/threonine protein kinase/class 3 adenylate cyclase